MTIEEILDKYSIEDFEVETSLMECIGRGIKTLRIYRKLHEKSMEKAKTRADEELAAGESETSRRWMDVYWRENRAVNLINDELRKYGIKDTKEGESNEN